MTEPESELTPDEQRAERERESRESPETKYDEERRELERERDEHAENLRDG